jgi:sortase A
VEGKSIYTVNKGVWHYPMGASPGQTGNTVFIGHRFTYNGPSVFAHLDLVKRGDNIALIWNGQRFSYTVSDIKIVEPWDTSIVKSTTDKRITVYTCTPMWTSKFRLAVIAEQDQP